MRRADRLFQIVQLMRRRRVATAAWLAEELDVSERTIYRDVVDLIRAGVPIEGEAGVGYALPRNFDLPPLMFDKDEIVALVLGARVVKSWGDPDLARAAGSVLAKVQAVVPDALKQRVESEPMFVPDFHVPAKIGEYLRPARMAIEERRKLALEYERADGESSSRIVRPLGLFFWGNKWSLLAWCELRIGFRNFRVDRIANLDVLDQRFEAEAGQTLDDYFAQIEREVGG